MPIECKSEIIPKGQEEFNEVDYRVMKWVFGIHNSMGRFYDENIYKNRLTQLCLENNVRAEREVEIKVIHKDFSKSYYLDLLIEKSSIYELKTVEFSSDSHEQQLINYLLLTSLHHGKLINFRKPSVEKYFCSQRLSHEKRKDFIIDDSKWDKSLRNSKFCKNVLRDLLNDWGTFLDFNLYKEALIHFLGGTSKIVKLIDILDNATVIGQQKVILLDEDIALHFAGISNTFQGYYNHVSKFLYHTKLKAVQWINFNKNKIILTTIKK